MSDVTELLETCNAVENGGLFFRGWHLSTGPEHVSDRLFIW